MSIQLSVIPYKKKNYKIHYIKYKQKVYIQIY